MANTIHLAGEFVAEEAEIASGQTIRPGKIVELNSSGQVLLQNAEGADCERAVAVEDALQGRDIDDDYADGTDYERVFFNIYAAGARSYVFLKAGETVVIGDDLMASSDGMLKKHTGTNTKIAKALEAADLSQTGDVDTRIAVRWL